MIIFHYNRKILCLVKIVLFERVAKLHRACESRGDVSIIEGVRYANVELLE